MPSPPMPWHAMRRHAPHATLSEACAMLAPLTVRFAPAPSPPNSGVEGTSYEIAIVVMGSYLAYLVAEVAGEQRAGDASLAQMAVQLRSAHDALHVVSCAAMHSHAKRVHAC